MPTFRCTAKRDIYGSKGLPKGATFQVLTPSGINSVNPARIHEAIKQQLGITLPGSCNVTDFDVVKIS